MTIRKLAEKIALDFQLTIKDRTDAITEKKKVKNDSKYLYKLIKTFNTEDGNLLLNHMDV